MVTSEQYERWHDFAIRMARTCFWRKRNLNPKEIERNVEHFFECLDKEDLLSIVDWDHSDPYPEGSEAAGVDYYGYPNEALPVTDMCKEHEEDWNPHYWGDRTNQQRDRDYERWISPVVCCIRAGLDLAVSPSAGVVGFTAGHLRKMYPEGVPDWITGGPDHRWVYAGTYPPKINGTFSEMPDHAEVWL